MCGIAGFTHNFSNKDKKSTSEDLYKALAHRGPDGYGIFQDDLISLVHARLSIIDLSSDGNQPIFNEDRSLVVICNGEIYNYKQIRNELIAKGHRFTSFSDSEVLVHLYEETGKNIEQVLHRLTGMFAFAIWDLTEKKLILTRDRLGIKPLYYSLNSKGIAFSSEVLPLIKSGLVKAEKDATSLFEYLMLGSIPEPNTYFENIKALPPGHFLVLEGEKAQIKSYWSVLDSQQVPFLSKMDEITDALDQLLDQVVQDHLIADVPVGTFLSAGIDSSLIAYYAAKHLKGIYAFTASFPGEPEDETIIANQTASFIGAQIQNYEVKNDFFFEFDEHFGKIDQPFGISSALSLSRISRLAQNKVKVVLSGDGADELFAGYERHRPFFDPPYFKNLPTPIRILLFEGLGKLSNNKNLLQAANYLRQSKSNKYKDHLMISSIANALDFLPDIAKNEINTERYLTKLQGHFNESSDLDLVNQLLFVDLKTSLVDEMLTKADRMTMHSKIEGRVPFLDHRLVEFAMSMPSQFKIQNGYGKTPLRMLIERFFGKELAYRKKSGFNSPIKAMVQQDAKTRQDLLNQLQFLKSNEILHPSAILKFTNSLDSKEVHPSQIFGMYALSKFHQQL